MVSSTSISSFAVPEAPPLPVVILLAATDILPSAHTPLLSQQNIEGQPPAFFVNSPDYTVSSASNPNHSSPLTDSAPTPAAAGPQRLLSVPPFQQNPLTTSSSPLPMLIEAVNGGASVTDDAAAAEVAEWDDLYVEIPAPCRVSSPVVRQFKYSRPVNSSHTALLKLMTMWSPEFFEDWKRSVTTAVEFMVQPVCYGSQTEETKAAMRAASFSRDVASYKVVRAHSDSFLMNEIEYFARLGLYKVAPGLHPIHPPTQVLEEYDAIDDVEYCILPSNGLALQSG
ncbi:hypothetical protein IW262DRAFT_1465525 [Armillaria fumosa]|nr:hypothetical protein IW262DRAFT_1465525 [Armillaria fumosa]